MSPDLADGFFAAKRFLVCGPGYVGGAVVQALLKLGASVDVLTRSEARLRAFEAMGGRGWAADIAGRDWHGQISTDYDGILFSISSGGGGVEGYRHSYEAGMASLRAWAFTRAVTAHLVYTSSTSVYDADGGAVVDESMATVATDERTEVLRAAEAMVADWPAASTVLRLAGIYGPGRHYLLDQLRDGAAVVAGRGDFHLNLVHLDDIVQAVLLTWRFRANAAGKVFNVADDGRALKAEVVTFLAQQLGCAMPEFSGVSAPGRRAQTPDRVISNWKLKAELGWRPAFPTFRDGYARILND